MKKTKKTGHLRQCNIVRMEYGSHLYKLNGPDSDMDYAGIYMPTLAEILLNKDLRTIEHSTGKNHVKNSSSDVDTKIYSLPVFLADCLSGDTTTIDMLHCDSPLVSSPIWEELVSRRSEFYCQRMKSYAGYVRSQAYKYGLKGDKLKELRTVINLLKYITEGQEEYRFCDDKTKIRDVWNDLPDFEYIKRVEKDDDKFYDVLGKKYQDTNSVGYVLDKCQKKWNDYGNRAKQALANDGMDWKALSHAVRVGEQMIAMYTKPERDFEYPLENSEFILKVKHGKASYKDEVAPYLDKLLDGIDDMAASSGFPETTNVGYWEGWLLEKYQEHFGIVYRG